MKIFENFTKFIEFSQGITYFYQNLANLLVFIEIFENFAKLNQNISELYKIFENFLSGLFSSALLYPAG